MQLIASKLGHGLLNNKTNQTKKTTTKPPVHCYGETPASCFGRQGLSYFCSGFPGLK